MAVMQVFMNLTLKIKREFIFIQIEEEGVKYINFLLRLFIINEK
tara:strand:- start:6273 stop:6404 length:132 start_codon:yes stop_codon:yes gene_type:complete